MQITSLSALVHQHLVLAREASSGRGASPSTAGTSTPAPDRHRARGRVGISTITRPRARPILQVLHGMVRLTGGGSAWDAIRVTTWSSRPADTAWKHSRTAWSFSPWRCTP